MAETAERVPPASGRLRSAPGHTTAGRAWGPLLAALAVLGAAHFVVDIVATTVNPLWPALEDRMGLADGGLLWAYVIWSASTSFSQLAFGFLGDRFRGRWLLWVGPAVAIVGLSLVGTVSTPLVLAPLLLVSGLGIAAFHPEGAALAGNLAPHARSRMMAIFALSGYLGQSLGPSYAGMLKAKLGMAGLSWTLAWALPMILVLAPLLHLAPGTPAPTVTTTRRRLARNRWGELALMLIVGVLRILPALGVPLVLAYLLDAQGKDTSAIGGIQSIFMAGIGIGGMLCALGVGPRHERRVLWAFPLAAVPVLASLGFLSGLPLAAAVGGSGLLLGVAMPVFIGYGQRLFPEAPRVASSITMGVSWGVSGGVVATMVWGLQAFEMLPAAFGLFAATTLTSSVLCMALPEPPAATA